MGNVAVAPRRAKSTPRFQLGDAVQDRPNGEILVVAAVVTLAEGEYFYRVSKGLVHESRLVPASSVSA